jgi:dephospho-CoA kinase
MNKKIILGFVGEMVSGKGTVAEYLQKKHNASTHRFSTMLRDVADRLYLEKSRLNLQKLSQVLRENFSQDIMARVMAEDVKNDINDIVIVEGIRRFADIEYLKKIDSFELIYITADIKIRYDRLTKRQENTDDQLKSFEDFQKDHEHESEIQVQGVGKTAEYIIDNNRNFEELYKQVDEILNK